MVSPVDAELNDRIRLWRDQWSQLRSWIETDLVMKNMLQPSVLEGWSVGDLLAHLGRTFQAATKIEGSDEAPLSLREYVAAYSSGATEISADAHRRASEPSESLLMWLDHVAVAGFEAVDAVDSVVIHGPRGPISRQDFVVSRLLELVVHGDDLYRSLPSPTAGPLCDDAVEVVGAALADAYLEVAGSRAGETGIGWIRRATGRVACDDPFLPLL